MLLKRVRFSAILMILLTSCLPEPGEIANVEIPSSASNHETLLNSEPTPAIIVQPTDEPQTQSSPQHSQDPASVQEDQSLEVLNFTFPTPVSESVSLWRPPLLQAPWALSPFDHFYFARPIAADEINWPLPNYRYGGIFFGTDIVHTGIDIPAPKGTPVLAAGPGKVIWAGYGLFYGTDDPDDPYGLAVSIEHDFGYKGQKLYSIYAHLDRIDIVNGQQVETGTPLGIVGITGKTTGPHLHFEVRIEENSFYTTRNPELWIAPPQGWGVLVGDFRNTNGSYLNEHVVNIKSIHTGRKWQVITYGPTTVHKDEYYGENLVIGDLPSGSYEVIIDYLDNTYEIQVQINPGSVTYLTFKGEDGFGFEPPATPAPDTWLTSDD